jgi:DNA-binding MarR family transcriptional regulator
MSSTISPEELADTVISVGAHLEAELEEALAEHGVTRTSFLVLEALEPADHHTLNQGELVRRVRRTSGTLSVRLARLERARLIVREPDPDNRRSVTVTLTQRGLALVRAARPTYAERAQRLVAGAPDAGGLGAQLSEWLAFFEPGEDEAEAPRLGVAVASAAIATRMRRAVGLPGEPGVLIMRVRPESLAAGAGLAQGDLVTHAAGTPVRSVGDLERAVRAADGTLAVNVIRGAEPLELQVSMSG